MTCLHIEDVPDELVEALHTMARRQHGSVSQIVVAILRRALLSPGARQRRLFPRRTHAVDAAARAALGDASAPAQRSKRAARGTTTDSSED